MRSPDIPPLAARRLTLALQRLPALPLSDGQRRAWGWPFLLRAAIGIPLRNIFRDMLPDAKVHIALHFETTDRLQSPWPQLRQTSIQQPHSVELLTSGVPDAVLNSALARLFEQLGGDNPLLLQDVESLPPPLPPDGFGSPSHVMATPDPHETEVALHFDTPLPFSRSDSSRTRITPAEVLALLLQRIAQVLGNGAHVPPAPAQLLVLCGYWHFVDITHASETQNNYQAAAGRRERLKRADPTLNNDHISGCLGRLYLRAPAPDMAALRPWLQWLQRWHLHASDGVALWGHFRLLDPAPPWFYPHLDNAEALLDLAHDTYRDYDVPPSHISGAKATSLPPVTEADLAAQLAQQLSSCTWQASPATRFSIPKTNGEARWVERLELRDLVAQRRVTQLLTPVLDATFSTNSIGYRKGMSRHNATERIRDHIRNGHRWVVEADIEDFFPSAPHTTVLAALHRLVPLADAHLRTLVQRMLTTPWLDWAEDKPTPRTIGLAQGAPLSPLLANLMLDQMDRALEPLAHHAMVRYADDFVLLARTKPEALNLLQAVRTEVQALGLQLAADKTRITAIEDGFDFLGEHFDRDSSETTPKAIAGQRKPLIIIESYLSLGLNGQAIDIRRDGKIVDTVPLRRISELIIFGKNSLSTSLMQRLAEHKVPLSMALDGGYQIAVVAPDSRRFHELAWMQSRRYYGMTDTERLSVAAAFVDAKLSGYAALVRKRNPICCTTLDVIDRALQNIGTCTTVQELRGFEGMAAKACFAWLQRQFRPDIRESFSARKRARGAGDRLNSVLNFGYYLSYTRLNGLVRASGLNPYLGFLHDALDDYETLVADLQELVRPYVDRLVIQMVNMGYIGPDSFEKSERGLYLTKASARTMATEFERMMGQKVIDQRLGDMLVTQVRQIRGFLCEGQALWLFHFGMGEAAIGTANDKPRPSDSIFHPDTESSLDDDEQEWQDERAT
jgi:CRISPR-associated protein Cas1